MVRALLIDLDDTLYDEGDYVRSGFHAVAAMVAGKFPTVSADDFNAAMLAELTAHGRGRVFDVALAQAGIAPDPKLVTQLVTAYRAHRPDIALWPGVEATLKALRADYRLAIVTDGLGLMQRRKVEALGVERLVDAVLYCWELDAPKPDPAAYREALRRLGAPASEALVIGDNPGHDMAAAEALGCRAIRVLSGRFAARAEGRPDQTVATFNAIPQLLRRMDTGEIGRLPWPQRP